MLKIPHLLLLLKAHLFIVAFVCGSCSPVHAQEEQSAVSALELASETRLSIIALTGQLAELGPELSLKTAMQSNDWQRLGEMRLDIGKTQPPKWLRLTLRNSTDSPLDLRLDTGLPELLSIDAWLIHSFPLSFETLISLRRTDPYSARPIIHRHIAADFFLAGKETATLVLRVSHDVQRKMNIRLLSTNIAASEAVRDAAFSSGFHTLIIGMLMLTLVSRRLVGNGLTASFATYLLSALLVVLGWEQQIFRFVFPDNRLFDLQLWIAMLNLMLAAQLQFGRSLFELHRYVPRYDKVVLAFVVVNLTYALVALITTAKPYQALDVLELPRLLGSVGLHFCTALLAWRIRIAGAWVFLLSSAFIAVSVLLRLFGLIQAESMLNLIRLLFIAESAVFTIALVQRATGMMRQRDAARDAEIESTRRELKTAHALNDSELAYAKTRRLADRYASRLASMGHDISQPLAALRLTLEKGMYENKGVAESLDYLEQLAVGDERMINEGSLPTQSIIDVRNITDRVAAMFESEAQSDSRQFKYDSGAGAFDAYAKTDGLALLRVLANLLSNAIRHASADTVNLSLSYKSNRLHIDISDDGVGMDDCTREAVMERHVRAGESDGQGLGLDIVRDNCRTQGYDLDFQSALGSGTRVRVTISAVITP